jgi:Contractile injection system tube protein
MADAAVPAKTSAISTEAATKQSSSLGKALGNVAKDTLVAAGNIAALEIADKMSQSRDSDYQAIEAIRRQRAISDYQKSNTDQRLVKAMLIPRSGETVKDKIAFMFNPTDLQFSRGVSSENVKGARTFRGLPKVNFGYIEPYQVKLTGLVFDTYETGQDVYNLIKPIRDAVDFNSFRDPFKTQSEGDRTFSERLVDTNIATVGVNTLINSASGAALGINTNVAAMFEYGVDLDSQPLEMRRPPVYYFVWGPHNYMLCMIKDLSFKLTMFLPNGTPLRAIVDLTLEEVDLGAASHALSERQNIVSKK